MDIKNKFKIYLLDEGAVYMMVGDLVGEVTRLGGGGGEATRLSTLTLTLISSRLHDRWGDPPYVTSPIWGPPPPCKQALSGLV